MGILLLLQMLTAQPVEQPEDSAYFKNVTFMYISDEGVTVSYTQAQIDKMLTDAHNGCNGVPEELQELYGKDWEDEE